MNPSFSFSAHTLFYLLFALAWINGFLYLHGYRKLVRFIGGQRPDLYDRLGQPPLRPRRWYAPDEIKAILATLGYILRGDFQAMDDQTHTRLARWLRLGVICQFFLLAAVFFLLPWTWSGSCTPDRTAATRQTSQSLVTMAWQEHQQGRYDQALQLLDRAVTEDPDDFSGHYYRAFVLEKMERYDEALTEFIRCIGMRPDQYDLYAHIDWILTRRGQWDDIVQYWSRYLEQHPDDARAWLERGGAYWRSGQVDRAASDAKRACDLGSREGCRRYRQARAATGTGSRGTALKQPVEHPHSDASHAGQ